MSAADRFSSLDDPSDDAPLMEIGELFDGANADWQAFRPLYHANQEDAAAVSRGNALCHKVDALALAVLAIPARTVEGAALHARAVASGMPELWDQPETELEWEQASTRHLIETVCRLAGVDLLGRSR